MHVCFFAHKNRKANNGATLSLINIANEMTNRGIKVTIIVPNKNVDYSIENMNIKMIYIPAFSMRTRRKDYSKTNKIKEYIKIIYNRVAMKRTLKIIEDDKPDIIHINGLDSEIGAEIANKLSIPYVWHIRQLLEEDFDQRLHNEEKIYGLVKKSDSVIAISKVVKDKFEKKLNKKLELIYNGIPLNKYMIVDRAPLFSRNTINILIAGRIVKQKGQFDAIKAVSYLIRKKGINNIDLTIVGNIQDESYAEKMNQYIEDNQLTNHIKVIEHVNDLRELRKKCDIGLICSKKEAFGRVTIETMASRMLIIGANTGGTVEIIENNVNGLLYEQGDYLSLANKINYAINNKNKMTHIAEEGFNTVIERYSISKVVDQITELYDELLEGRVN